MEGKKSLPGTEGCRGVASRWSRGTAFEIRQRWAGRESSRSLSEENPMPVDSPLVSLYVQFLRPF